MTLLEICFSLLIIAIIFGASIPFAQELFSKHPLEAQLDSFEEMVRTAIKESQSENRSAYISFDEFKIQLFGENTNEVDEGTAEQLEEIIIPGGAKYQIQLWPDFEWVKPQETSWSIPATGLILPLNIRWSLDDSWIAASIDPMTGEIKDVTYELR